MSRLIRHAARLAMACFAITSARSAEPSFTDLEKLFRELPMEARRLTGPLFWLHGDETPAQLKTNLQKVVESGNGMFVAEARPHNDWLGKGWYRDLDLCLKFAKENNLKMVIYDDYWWPSQMMGGRVPPKYGSKILTATEVKITGPKRIKENGYGDEKLISVIAGKEAGDGTVDGASLVNLTTSVRNGILTWSVPAGEWRIMKFIWAFKGPTGFQQQMISLDGADPECVAWFIKTVYQPHYDRYKEDFGKTIVSFFYDEPETQGDWGRDMLTLAAERKLDLNRMMVAYKFKLSGEGQATAYYNYLNLFTDSWGRTMYGGLTRWCSERKVISMGHFMEHDYLYSHRELSGGNMMQLQKYSGMGGMDVVCGMFLPGQRNMDDYQTPKFASSISHTYNKKDDIAFSEVYGAYGQNITYPQMKWLADWHHVRGVNLMNTHSFNPRAPYDTDCPPFFYNGGFEPRFPLYHVWSDYTNRLSIMLTGGRHVSPVAYLNMGQSFHAAKATRPEEFTSAMQDALLDCDWLLYDAWENNSSFEGKKIRLHKEQYSILVVPPVEIIPYATLAKAKEFFEKGGIVVGYDFLPTLSATLGKASADITVLRKAIWGDAAPGLTACNTSPAGGKSYFLPGKPNVEDVRKALIQDAGVRPTLDVVKGETNNWLHVLHRVKSGRDVFLVCNQNHEGEARPFTLRITAAGEPECWDSMRNEITALPCRRLSESEVEVDLVLEPSESVLLVFQQNKRALPMRLDASVKPMREPITVVRGKTPPALIIPSAPDTKKEGKPAAPLTVSPVTSDPFLGQAILPSGLDPKQMRIYLEMDELAPEAAARVTVNKIYAGGFIGKPFRLDVTRYVKAGTNTIQIEPFAPKNAKLVVYPR